MKPIEKIRVFNASCFLVQFPVQNAPFADFNFEFLHFINFGYCPIFGLQKKKLKKEIERQAVFTVVIYDEGDKSSHFANNNNGYIL